MNKKILLVLIGLTLVSSVMALDSLGTYTQNECLNISQMCSSCSYVEISSVTTNRDSGLISNVDMDYYGSGEWRYEFCDTSYIGRYDVKGQGDINGIDENFAVYFEVTPNGLGQNLGFYIIWILLSIGIIVLGYYSQDQWVVILGAFVLVLFGLYVLFYGIVGIKDAVYTWGIGIVTLMLGLYFGIRGSMEGL